MSKVSENGFILLVKFNKKFMKYLLNLTLKNNSKYFLQLHLSALQGI